MKTATVSSRELGTNCWHPCRFIKDNGRCDRVWTCSYPEKKTCQAVNAEIQHDMEEQTRLIRLYHNIDQRILELQNMLEK